MIRTRFTELTGSKYPVQLAGMPGVCTTELAAAVADAGGLGMISATHASPEILLKSLDGIRNSSKGLFGVNFLIPFLDLECVRIAAGRSRVVEFFYGDPDPFLVKYVHREGALASWQVGSLEEAIAAYRAKCDFIVAQGAQAGGHVRGDINLSELLSEVINSVDIPVVATGGITTGADLVRVLKAGAAGARIGTRFVAAKESGAHQKYIDALINAKEGDTILTETFSLGWPHAHHRVLRSCVDEVNKFQGDIVGERELAGEKNPIPKYSIALPTKDTTGHIEAMALYAGESVGEVKRVQSAGDIVREIVKEAESVIESGI